MAVRPWAALRGRRVLVTGHTGFKGAWLSVWLADLGAEVHGLALDPPTRPSCYEACGVARLLAGDVRADVRDEAAVRGAVDAAAPEVVFHLAAQSLVRASYERPVETFATNVLGTAHVLEAVRRRGRPCAVVVVTSDKCYENRERDEAFAEDDPLGGRDPYSASKGAAEIVASSYRRSFFDGAGARGLPRLATARAGNVIGGGDWAADRIVPDLLRALTDGRRAQVRNPASVRPWQHVLEPLSGYLTLAARLLDPDDPVPCAAWNFGPTRASERSVGELARLVLAAWGGGSVETPHDPSAPHEARVLRLDAGKAASQLGWRPRWDLETAVERTVRWARVHAAGGDVLAACRADVAAYEAHEPAGVRA